MLSTTIYIDFNVQQTIKPITINFLQRRLDQQIWGSEDEEEIDEEQQQKEKKDEKGSGESTGEKEMAAKDEEQGADDDSEGKEKKQKKDINEMEEPEMDDDQVRKELMLIRCSFYWLYRKGYV